MYAPTHPINKTCYAFMKKPYSKKTQTNCQTTSQTS